MPEDHDAQREMDEPICYQIRVQGKLDQDWSTWFNGLAIALESEDPPITSLTGEVADQASLRGILTRIWNLNLCLVSLNRVEPGKEAEHDNTIRTSPG